MAKITKKAIAEFVREKLKTDDKWAKAALLKIYDKQTAEEQNIGHTCVDNNVGFSEAHAEIMSSFAVQLRTKGYVSYKQMVIIHKVISKYTRQIIEISDEVKLKKLVTI